MDPSQLALPFAVRPTGAGGVGPTSHSRRDRRSHVAGRRVRLGATDRDVEETRLETALWGHLPPGKTLRLTLTDNRYTMVAVRRGPAGYTVRIHRMFVGVDGKMMRALARYIVHNDRRASGAIGDFIEKHQHIIRQQPRRARRLNIKTAGKHHDLRAIFDQLNKDRFDGGLEAQITWGPGSPRRRRNQRSIKMGSFSIEDRIIRIHPVLDHESVPSYFVAWIVFHEMLHGKHEVVRRGGRRCFHSREFLAEERSFTEYDRACGWEKANIERLLGG